MGWFLSFASDDHDGITDSDEVATTRGWDDFAAWAAGLDGGRYPALTFFVEEGGLGEAADIAQMEEDLAVALRVRPGGPSPDVQSVGWRLLHELRRRPGDADALVITDGTSE